MRFRTPLLAASLLAAGFFLTTPSYVFASDEDVLAAVFGEKSEADGKWDLWLPKLVEAVAKDPNSPYALAAIQKISAIASGATSPQIIEEKLQAVLDGGIEDGETDEALRDLLVSRAEARGDFDAAKRMGATKGYLTRFAVTGPIGWSDAVLVHRAYGPEANVIDPTAEWEGTASKVRWTTLPEQTSGMIDASPYVRNAGAGVMYSVCRVKSETAQNVAIKVICDDSYKVIVNGRDVIVADREGDYVPSTVWADVALVAGWNRVLVKVTGRSSFALKICDATTGKGLSLEQATTPLEAGPAPDAGPLPSPRKYRTPTERALLAEGGESRSALRSAGAGLLALGDGRTWDSFESWRRAASGEAKPGSVADANIQAGYGRVLSDFAAFPPVQRKLQAIHAFEQAVKAYPNHASARVRLAEFDNQDDHPDKAVKALESLTKEAPSSLVSLAIARIARARGWDREALEAAKQALALQPNSEEAMDFLDSFDRQGANYDGIEKRNKHRLEINRGNRDAANAMVTRLRAQGNHAEALALLATYVKQWPTESGWRRQTADTLRALSRDAEALPYYRALMAEFPSDPWLPRIIGEIAEVAGDSAAAKASYEQSLAIDSNQPALRRAVARIDQRDEDFGIGWEPDVSDIIAKLPSTEELKKTYPKASAVTVLDHTVTRVNADGTAQSYVHMIYKVLDEKGVEKYESLPNAGELLLVTATLPDGRVTTPSSLPGRPFNIEGLVPGTLLEQRYTSYDAATARGYNGDQFFFQDFQYDDNPNPVVLSRLVMLTPESVKLDPEVRNFNGEPRVETKDGTTATIWEKRDMPRIDAEANMPGRDEIVPHVDYSLPPRTGDAPWEIFSQRQDVRPTPFVEEALAQCVVGSASDTEKVRAIYDWVNREITGDSGSAWGPTAVLLDKSGNRAVLMESMIRAAKIPCRLGRAMPWNGVGFRVRDGASAYQGAFLWIEPRDGKAFPLFVAGQYAPFGVFPEAYRGSAAYVTDERGGEIRRLPLSTDPDGADYHFVIKLGAAAADTTLAATMTFHAPGAYNFKRQLLEMAQDDRQKFAERQLSGFFATPKLTKYDLPRVDERGVPLTLTLDGTMTNYITQQGDTFVAALGLPATNAGRRFVDRADRTYDLVLRQRDDRVDDVIIDLGTAFEVKTLPADHTASHDVGTYSLTFRQDGNRIRVLREYHFQPARYRADEYKRFVEWCKSIDDAELAKIEFRRTR